MSKPAFVDAPTTLYRCFAVADVLLYVGITNGTAQRLYQHSKQPWWPDVTKVTFDRFPDRDSAAQAERRAIATEEPVHNRKSGNRTTDAARAAIQADDSFTDRDKRILLATLAEVRRIATEREESP